MFTVFFIMLAGMALGFLLRGTKLPYFFDKAISLLILLLLFSLGVVVGSNDEIVRNLPILGGQSLVLTVAAMAGSVACAILLSRFFFPKNPFRGAYARTPSNITETKP